LGIGDWGLGIGDWAQSPIPNPQSPIPNPHLSIKFIKFIINKNKIIKKIIIYFLIIKIAKNKLFLSLITINFIKNNKFLKIEFND